MCIYCNDLFSDECTSYGAESAKKIREFEKDILDCLTVFNVKEIMIPTLISGSILRKCGYFDTSPHHLTLAAHAHPDYFDEIICKKRIDEDQIQVEDTYLTPAACLHIYPMLENKKMTEPLCVTTSTRVYRYEGGKHIAGSRLWDFAVREVVFIGEEQYVKSALERVEEWIAGYVKKFDHNIKWQQAFDYFYETPKNDILKKFQLKNNLKKELVLQTEKGSLAIASINYHDNHFSKPFEFDNAGKIVTGCIGFGLDRWHQVL